MYDSRQNLHGRISPIAWWAELSLGHGGKRWTTGSFEWKNDWKGEKYPRDWWPIAQLIYRRRRRSIKRSLLIGYRSFNVFHERWLYAVQTQCVRSFWMGVDLFRGYPIRASATAAALVVDHLRSWSVGQDVIRTIRNADCRCVGRPPATLQVSYCRVQGEWDFTSICQVLHKLQRRRWRRILRSTIRYIIIILVVVVVVVTCDDKPLSTVTIQTTTDITRRRVTVI